MELRLQRLSPKVTHHIVQNIPSAECGSKDQDKKTSGYANGDAHPRITYSHCSLSPDIVRSEVESHRVDFNFKMKRALFQSFICAYYVGFIPMQFSEVS